MNISPNSPQVDALRKEIEKETGSISSHSTLNKLSALIEERCKEHISVTTLERIWGYSTRSCNNISVRILDIISRFAGYSNWENFCNSLRCSQRCESQMFMSEGCITSNTLAVRTRIRIGWQPDRVCEAEYMGENRFIAIKTENSSIRPGDTFRCLQIEKGRELYMDHFTRNGESESDNRYAVGQINGLTMAEIIE
ncbi:MAG: hypothetical protein IKJ23_02715 [Bacteroidaceae bacterium]|nr:hypothetical protein [Bacteroidaceae bacterium]